jgi:hypothetical protein
MPGQTTTAATNPVTPIPRRMDLDNSPNLIEIIEGTLKWVI